LWLDFAINEKLVIDASTGHFDSFALFRTKWQFIDKSIDSIFFIDDNYNKHTKHLYITNL